MSKWEFKAVELVGGVSRLVELSEWQRSRVGDYERALVVAIQGDVSRPPFSNYFVRASVGPLGGEPVAAGNIEYGLCQAIHGEESAVAAFRSRYGNKATASVLAFVGHAPGGVPRCCGNCRDIMRGDLGPDLEIVDGHPDGGVATVMGLDQCLVDDYPEVRGEVSELGLNRKKLRDLVRKTWQEGEELANDGYSPADMVPERKYAALVMTETNNYYGGRDVMADYHPIYGLRDAVRAARRNHDCLVRGVVIVSRSTSVPDVMYKDRQHLLELNLQGELARGGEQDPPVYLATCDSDDAVTGIWRTTVKTWLPLAFTPRNFMDMDKFTEYQRSKSR